MHFAPVRAERTPRAPLGPPLHSRNPFGPRALTPKQDACVMLAPDLRKSFQPFPCPRGRDPPFHNETKTTGG